MRAERLDLDIMRPRYIEHLCLFFRLKFTPVNGYLYHQFHPYLNLKIKF
jgi:hypothetical protein